MTRTASRAKLCAMSTIDYLLGLALLGLILWNMRPHELTDRRLRRPVLIAAAICVAFLHGVPTHGADGALVAVGVLTGIACGAVSALATRVHRDPARGTIIAVASPLAVTVTAAAFAGRIGFALAATHGLGPQIADASRQMGIHSQQAWVAALVLMAAADLVVRAAILRSRRGALAAQPPATPTADLASA